MVRKILRKSLVILMVVIGLAYTFTTDLVSAMPIITGYNIEDGTAPGGGWNHFYTGTIINDGTGEDYSGGSGTMNDGLIGTNHNDTQYFTQFTLNPVITLFLDNTYDLLDISLFSFGSPPLNSIPGNIIGLDVNGSTFATTAFGPTNSTGPAHEFASILSLAATNTVVLSNFTAIGLSPNEFSISEITFNGTIAQPAIPEPTTIALLGIGLVGLAGAEVRRRRKKKAVDKT